MSLNMNKKITKKRGRPPKNALPMNYDKYGNLSHLPVGKQLPAYLSMEDASHHSQSTVSETAATNKHIPRKRSRLNGTGKQARAVVDTHPTADTSTAAVTSPGVDSSSNGRVLGSDNNHPDVQCVCSWGEECARFRRYFDKLKEKDDNCVFAGVTRTNIGGGERQANFLDAVDRHLGTSPSTRAQVKGRYVVANHHWPKACHDYLAKMQVRSVLIPVRHEDAVEMGITKDPYDQYCRSVAPDEHGRIRPNRSAAELLQSSSSSFPEEKYWVLAPCADYNDVKAMVDRQIQRDIEERLQVNRKKKKQEKIQLHNQSQDESSESHTGEKNGLNKQTAEQEPNMKTGISRDTTMEEASPLQIATVAAALGTGKKQIPSDAATGGKKIPKLPENDEDAVDAALDHEMDHDDHDDDGHKKMVSNENFLLETIRGKDDVIHEKNAEIQRLQEQVDNLTHQNAQNTKEKTKLEKEVAKNRDDRRGKQEKMYAKLDEKYRKLEEEQKTLQEELEELRQKTHTMQNQIDVLQEENRTLNDEKKSALLEKRAAERAKEDVEILVTNMKKRFRALSPEARSAMTSRAGPYDRHPSSSTSPRVMDPQPTRTDMARMREDSRGQRDRGMYMRDDSRDRIRPPPESYPDDNYPTERGRSRSPRPLPEPNLDRLRPVYNAHRRSYEPMGPSPPYHSHHQHHPTPPRGDPYHADRSRSRSPMAQRRPEEPRTSEPDIHRRSL
jgi:hypothetical protein